MVVVAAGRPQLVLTVQLLEQVVTAAPELPHLFLVHPRHTLEAAVPEAQQLLALVVLVVVRMEQQMPM